MAVRGQDFGIVGPGLTTNCCISEVLPTLLSPRIMTLSSTWRGRAFQHGTGSQAFQRNKAQRAFFLLAAMIYLLLGQSAGQSAVMHGSVNEGPRYRPCRRRRKDQRQPPNALNRNVTGADCKR